MLLLRIRGIHCSMTKGTVCVVLSNTDKYCALNIWKRLWLFIIIWFFLLRAGTVLQPSWTDRWWYIFNLCWSSHGRCHKIPNFFFPNTLLTFISLRWKSFRDLTQVCQKCQYNYRSFSKAWLILTDRFNGWLK